MKKPKICFVNPPLLLKRPISEIMYKLSKKGYSTSLLVPKRLFRKRDKSLHHSQMVEKEGKAGKGQDNQGKIYTYSVINPPFLSSEQPIPVTPAFVYNIFRAMKNNDIIHMWVPYYLTSLKIIWIKKIFYPRKKLILTMDTVPGYSFSMGKGMNKLFKLYNKLFGRIIFGTPDVVTLYGKSLVPYAIKAGVPKEKIRVISTGIDVKKGLMKDADKNLREVRKELNLDPGAGVVLYAGLIVPRKGIEKITRVADKLRKENIVFIIAGDGPKRKEYEKKAEELGVQDKVLFLGWRTDMKRLYQASDLVLLPAEGEGLPGIVMEAMAAGVPCVASDIPCIPDLIENGKSGFLCDKDDIPEFAARIRQLLKNKALRDKMGKEAMKKMKEFEWDDVIVKYEELYRSLTGIGE